MAGHRFVRQRRASLRPFAAVQIAEALEARRLLAAVSDEGLIDAPQPETPVAECLMADAEEYTEEYLPMEYSEGVVDEELPGEPIVADPVTEDVVPDEEDAGTEEFRPILVVCEFPEELWLRCPDDVEAKAEAEAEDCSVVYKTQDVEMLAWSESTGEPAAAAEDLPHADEDEWDWHFDFSTARGAAGETEYVAFDGPEQPEFTDTPLIESGVSDEGTWTDFIDAGTEVTGDISFDDTISEEFLPDAPMLWSRDNDLAAGEEYEPQVMLFSSVRGGVGVVLRTLTLSVPNAAPQDSSPADRSNVVPEHRRMESVFAVREGVLGRSGDRAADSRLVSVRTESRAATPGTTASVFPRRSRLLTGLSSDSATPQEAAAVDGGEELDLFEEGRVFEDQKRSRGRQSQSESHEDVSVPHSSETTGAAVSRTTSEYSNSGETVTVSVEPESAAVSGLATGKQVPR